RLHDDRRFAWIRHVDGGDVLRRRFVSQPQDATPVARQLDDHALAAIAEAVEVVVSEEAQIPPEIRSAHDDVPRSRSALPKARGGAPQAPLHFPTPTSVLPGACRSLP